MILDPNSQKQAREFFETHYRHLRPHGPMQWMLRMFDDVVVGQYPRLVNLPTGAGKTEMVVIWLLALAWYGRERSRGQPIPRRMVWIINRRVLVQQVFGVANKLLEMLAVTDSDELKEVRGGLSAVNSAGENFFEVIQLRGQIVPDRDWAIRPTTPQLIIGTVDQIGSRLLFQGYGLGKWGRPQQAGLLGVDSWVAVDEAHLVPAFVLTLRQLHVRCAAVAEDLPQPLKQVFGRLPFWLTELSATPGLPEPEPRRRDAIKHLRKLNKATKEHGLTTDEQMERQELEGSVFSLRGEEEKDDAIANRILAFKTRRVELVWLTAPEGKKPANILPVSIADAAKEIAKADRAGRVAIFVRTVKLADAIKKQLKASILERNICKITGRLRGYERDRIIEHTVFRRFLSQREEESADPVNDTVFLIGTAAAEVGLDADADVILCDFAPLLTLLQRLGRLDRRGQKSKGVAEGGAPPVMRIFSPRRAGAEEQKSRKQYQAKEVQQIDRLSALAEALANDMEPCSASLMAGAYWISSASKNQDTTDEAPGPTDKDSSEKKKSHIEELVETATWKVLNPKPDNLCDQPWKWLEQKEARVAAGPVVVPPLTDAILGHWCATTEDRSRYLTPHPFLYGLLAEDEGVPLIGVAFRLELGALREASMDSDEDDVEEPAADAEVIEIFTKFPPLRAELHQIPIQVVREWLDSPDAKEQPIVYRGGERWRLKPLGESTSSVIDSLAPGMMLVLAASADLKENYKKLLEDCQDADTALCDVLDGVSKHAHYRREVKEKERGKNELRLRKDGAWLWGEPTKIEDSRVAHIAARFESGEWKDWKSRLSKELRMHGGVFIFRYSRPSRQKGDTQFLDDVDGEPGHISRAKDEAGRLAQAISPDDEFLKSLLCNAAFHHDEGKRHKKWQLAFGREEQDPELAKLNPKLKKNAPMHGFRHEWESLRLLDQVNEPAPVMIADKDRPLWRDLLLHLVGTHHGYIRPSLGNSGLNPDIAEGKQNALRLEAAGRFARLQKQIGPWRLAYLEALLKTADALASQEEEHDED